MGERIAVVAAAVVRDGLVLCAQRPYGGRLPGSWEFPGGKIEKGETPKEALRRELDEELSLCVGDIGPELATTHHSYPFAEITLTTFMCVHTAGEFVLHEHQAARWVRPSDLGGLEWSPADVPAVSALRRLLIGEW